MKYLRWLILASGIIPLFAWEGKIFQVSGKKVTIASSQTSGVRAGTRLYILKDGKEVGQGRVGNVFHTKVEMALISGAVEKGLIVTDKKPGAENKPAVVEAAKTEEKKEPPPEYKGPPNEDLILAATYGDTDGVQKALNAGADLNTKGSGNSPAIYYAAYKGHSAVVRQLIAAGANIDAQGYLDYTALHAAIERRHPQVVRILVEAKANVNIRNEVGWTPLKQAQISSKDPEIIELLKAAGAKE